MGTSAGGDVQAVDVVGAGGAGGEVVDAGADDAAAGVDAAGAGAGDAAGGAGSEAGAGAGNEAAAGGNNVQLFTEALNGAAAPAVIEDQTADRRECSPPQCLPILTLTTLLAFTVEGSTFLNAGAAIGRSCDVQKNKW